MTKPEIEAALEALDLTANPEIDPSATEAGAFAAADAAQAEQEAMKGDAAKEASDEKEEEAFVEEEDAAFLAAQAQAAKKEAAKKASLKEQEEEFKKEEQAAEKEAAKKAAAAIEAAAKKEAAKKKAAADAAAAKEAAAKKAEAAAKSAAAKKTAAAKEAAAKKEAEEKQAAADAAAAIEAAERKEAAKKAAQPVAPPPFSYADVGMFSNCYANTAQKSSGTKSFRNGVRFSISPPLPEGIKLDSKTGTISGTYKKDVAKGQKDVVKHVGFAVTAALSGLETTHHFTMKLEEGRCSAQPPYLWAVLAAVLLLLCLLCFFCRRKQNGTLYVPLKKQVTKDQARINQITANEHPTPAPRPAHITAAKPAPVPPTPAASVSLASFAKEATQTWTLKGAQHPKGQSSEFVDPDALAGQVGCTSTWKLTPGVPLTFHTPAGEVKTVFALKKPLQLAYDQHAQPIKITRKEEGHGTDLGIDLGWTLSGIGYQDITTVPFAEADRLLHEKIGQLPGAIPLTFKRNNGKVQTTYAYQRPMGLTFNRCLPIKITAEEEGHHAQHIGIKVGWELLAINYINIQSMTDFDQVSAILVREISELPTEAL